jgi:hypothetical protein
MRLLFAAVLTLALPTLATTEEGSGCDKFAWSLSQELRLFAAANKPTIVSGAALTTLPNDAVILSLQPTDKVSFTLAPERPAKTDGFGAAIALPRLERSGIYQVTLSDDAWVDIVQDGRYARSVGSSGRRDCKRVRKSVRFELQALSFALQISGSSAERVTIAVRRIE